MIKRGTAFAGFIARAIVWGAIIWSGGIQAQQLIDEGSQGQALVRGIELNNPPLVTTSRPPELGVMDRPHSAFDSEGNLIGSFIVNAALVTDIGYNDNVYARSAHPASDLSGTVSPSVKVRSIWARHRVEGGAQLDVRRYLAYDQENVETGYGALAGRADIDSDTFMVASLRFNRLYTPRGELETSVLDAPERLSAATIGAALYHGAGPLTFSASSAMQSYRYDDGRTVSGGLVDNRGRSYSSTDVSVRVGYELSPAFNPYVRTTLKARNNDRFQTGASPSRDSQAYQVVVGTIFDFNELWSGEVFIGSSHRNFEYGGFKDVDTVTYGGKLLWNVTRITSLRFAALRDVEPSLFTGSPAYAVSHFWASIEHEAADNAVFHANIGKRLLDYRQSDLSAEIVTAGFGAIWLINPRLRAAAEYNYTNRAARMPTPEFKRNVALLRLTVQF